jgi:hypothetical protein
VTGCRRPKTSLGSALSPPSFPWCQPPQTPPGGGEPERVPAKAREIVTFGTMSSRPEGAHIAGIRIDHGGTVPRERPSSAVGATAWRAQPTTGSRHEPSRLRRRRNRWRVRRRVQVAGGRYRSTNGPGPGASCREPGLGSRDTISSTVRVRRTSWNVMKPLIQCVLTQ